LDYLFPLVRVRLPYSAHGSLLCTPFFVMHLPISTPFIAV